MMGGSALARAPKVGTQSPYFHRFNLGAAEVTVVSDGPLPLGDPSSTFLGVPKEEVKRILQALAHVPEQDRIVFELFAIEGFSKDAVARIYNISPEEVTQIVERVRSDVLRELRHLQSETINTLNRRAS